MADNYSTIDNPYDGVMNRTPGGISAVVTDISTQWNQPAAASSLFDPTVVGASADNATYTGFQGTATSTGAVETQNVNTNKSMNDLWIDTFIRSANWKPGARGFNIDGRTGNAEFNNVLVRGTIESSIIIGSTIIGNLFQGITLDASTITGSTITGSTLTGTTLLTAGDITTGNYVSIDASSMTIYYQNNPTFVARNGSVFFNTIQGISSAVFLGWSGSHFSLSTANLGVYDFFDTSFRPGANNLQDCGSASYAWANVYAYNYPAVSDARSKADITPITYGLGTILSLNPVSFTWNDDQGGRRHLGVIAQEIAQTIPEVVSGSEDTRYSVSYNELVPVLIKAIQELEARVKTLEKANTNAVTIQ